ncbi:hypothetical protein C2E23DRAFT_575533 [Lenzites betulinus]|nr:hypothetical protein C2E23DRAFT_575533 [Lenzites betulinus]
MIINILSTTSTLLQRPTVYVRILSSRLTEWHLYAILKMDITCVTKYLEIGCKCCELQYNLWLIAGEPPPPQKREGDQKGEIHKELMQCQFCYKSKRDGITFFRCGGCQIEIYCSKACQKQAWSRHKQKCAINRKYQPTVGIEPKPMKDVRAFTSKHRPSISKAAAAALDVANAPQNAQQSVFAVFLRPRPSSSRTETSFWAVGAAVVPFSAFPAVHIAEMKGQLKAAHDLNVANGSLGAMEVVMVCIDPNVMNVVMMGFSGSRTPIEDPGTNWKHWLLHRLNEGLVW